MPVELKTVGRTREITGVLYMVRWLQVDSGTDQIFGNADASLAGDLNTLDALADSRTAASSGRMWYGGAEPGAKDDGETDPAWFGREIRVPFRRLQGSAEWHLLRNELQSFMEAAFPGEIILEDNRRMERPQPVDISTPAKYVVWSIEDE